MSSYQNNYTKLFFIITYLSYCQFVYSIPVLDYVDALVATVKLHSREVVVPCLSCVSYVGRGPLHSVCCILRRSHLYETPVARICIRAVTVLVHADSGTGVETVALKVESQRACSDAVEIVVYWDYVESLSVYRRLVSEAKDVVSLSPVVVLEDFAVLVTQHQFAVSLAALAHRPSL